MNSQQAENLRKFIRHMETKCNRTLGMNYVSDCGTPSCAMGEIPAVFHEYGLIISKDWGRISSYLWQDGWVTLAPFTGWIGIGYVSEKLFGFPHNDDFLKLFGSSMCNAWHRHEVSPKEWVAEARKVLNENGYTMDDEDSYDRFIEKVYDPVALEEPELV